MSKEIKCLDPKCSGHLIITDNDNEYVLECDACMLTDGFSYDNYTGTGQQLALLKKVSKAARVEALNEALAQVKYESDVLQGQDLSEFEGLDSVDVIKELIEATNADS